MRRLLVLATLMTLAVIASCSDDDGDDGTSAAEIEIQMVDNAYEPESVEVAAGEEVTFAFDNSGAALHEAYIGDEVAQEEHAAAMAEGDEHGGGHGGDDTVEVEPGTGGALAHTFDEPGEYLIGCHQPGHYEDGMRMRVTVV